MAKAVTRIKKSQTSVPASLFEADVLVQKIGQTQDAINEIKKELKREIAELKVEAAKKLAPLALERSNQINALFAFANPQKDELTEEARSIELASGVFGWRWTTPRVETQQDDKETVARLKANGNDAFVRVVEKVNRRAILAQQLDIPGISCIQSDEFFVVPKQKAKKAKTFTQVVDR